MKFMLYAIILLAILVMLTGAGCTSLAESATSNIDGWDLSACVNGFGTCWDLFWDNQDKITGGAGTITNLLNPLESAPAD